MTERIAHPPIASYEAWLAARKELLAEEKELTEIYMRTEQGKAAGLAIIALEDK